MMSRALRVKTSRGVKEAGMSASALACQLSADNTVLDNAPLGTIWSATTQMLLHEGAHDGLISLTAPKTICSVVLAILACLLARRCREAETRR